MCDHDGKCETDEICTTCGSDCVSSAGAFCGNGVCEPTIGESCLSCPGDCAGSQAGKPNSRYCCGNGSTGQNPVTCADSRCTQGARECSNTPQAASCCGDLQCGGVENSFNCALDCGPPPACDPTETSCTDAARQRLRQFLRLRRLELLVEPLVRAGVPAEERVVHDELAVLQQQVQGIGDLRLAGEPEDAADRGRLAGRNRTHRPPGRAVRWRAAGVRRSGCNARRRARRDR